MSTADYRHKDFDCSPLSGVAESECKRLVGFEETNGTWEYGNGTGPCHITMNPKQGNGMGFIFALIGAKANPNSYSRCGTDAVGGEYIIQELSSPLIAGKAYNVKMFAQLEDDSDFASKELSIFFTKTIPKTADTDCGIGNIDTQTKITKSDPNGLKNRDDWMEIGGTITAEGGEKYLVIGVLNPTLSKMVKVGVTCTNSNPIVGPPKRAVYGIDAISVTFDLCEQPELKNNLPMTMTFCKTNTQTMQTTCSTKSVNTVVSSDFFNAAAVPKTPWSLKVSNAIRYKLEVFNRWGNKVFTKEEFDRCGFNEKKIEWYGTLFESTSTFVPTGSYWANLEVQNCSETKSFIALPIEIYYSVQTPPIPSDNYVCSCPPNIKAYFPSNFSSDCTSGKYFENTIISSPTVTNASVIITAKNTTITGNSQNVYLLAGQQVEMGENFTVEKGTEFVAGIQGCGISIVNSLMHSNNNSTRIQKAVNDTSPISESQWLSINENLQNVNSQLNSSNQDYIEVYPNPLSNNSLEIILNIKEAKEISLILYDVQGRLIKKLTNSELFDKGFNNRSFKVDLPTGTYFLHYQDKNNVHIKKIIKL